MTNAIARLSIAVALIALVAGVAGWVAGSPATWQTATVALCLAVAIGIRASSSLRTFQFTAWVIAVVCAAIFFPWLFQPFTPNSTPYKWLLLLMIQAVMFGMGTQISIRDFAGVAKQPWPVAVGLLCQFTIMPLVGYTLAITFKLPAEVAAGMVLIGSCSSGLASNVMVYLAKANLALSITLTAVATMLAPVVTPFWMKLLASGLLEGTDVEVSFWKMMAGIVKIVIVPTGAALMHDYMKHGSPAGRRLLQGVTWLALAALCTSIMGVWPQQPPEAGETYSIITELFAITCGGVVFGMLYHQASQASPWLDRQMPVVAMIGILYVTGMTTAQGREYLLLVGGTLILAAALHNLLGYVLGYWMSRLVGLDVQSARTIAFEVGLQNGGMATGLASELGKLGTLGLPAAFFIAWMNVSGSMLANFWRRVPVANSTPTPQESLA